MEMNDDNLLKQSRTQIARTGKYMNLFSIFAAIGMLLMVVGGIFLLAYGSRIDPDLPNYLMLLISFTGIALILLTAVLVVPLLRMRRAIRLANEVAHNNDEVPFAAYHTALTGLWRYMTWFLIVIFILGVLATLIASFLILNAHNAI